MIRPERCSFCGGGFDVLFGWRCRRCYSSFCGEHRLPENHGCMPRHTPCDECGVFLAAWECGCGGAFCQEHAGPGDHGCPVPKYGPRQAMGAGRVDRRRRRRAGRAKPAAAAGAVIAVIILAVFLIDPGEIVGPADPGSVKDVREQAADQGSPAAERHPAGQTPDMRGLVVTDLGSLHPDSRPDYSRIGLIGTYYVAPIPPYYPATDAEAALDGAFGAWTGLNRGLDLRRVYEPVRSDLVITWQKMPISAPADLPGGTFTTGLATTQYPGRDEILIGLGITDCTGEWHGMDAAALTGTLAHEVGHILRLGHSPDESHLMFGGDPEIQFDDLGLRVPALEMGHYGEYAEWKARHDRLSATYDELYLRYGELDARLGDRMTVWEYNLMVAEINGLVDRMDSIYGELDGLVDDMNCMYSVRPG